MGVYRKLVKTAQTKSNPEYQASKRILTPATVGMTAPRPVVAVKVAKMLLAGEKGVTPWVLGMIASDMEGIPARWLDKVVPDWNIGTSEFGAMADPVADWAALTIVAGAAMRAPRISKPAKAAMGLVFAQQTKKSIWYANAGRKYAAATATPEKPKGEKLVLHIGEVNKEGMLEQMEAVGLAVATNDHDSPFIRNSLGGLAIGHAIPGAYHSEQGLHDMQQQFRTIMLEYPPVAPAA
jgi:hypothetical protein